MNTLKSMKEDEKKIWAAAYVFAFQHESNLSYGCGYTPEDFQADRAKEASKYATEAVLCFRAAIKKDMLSTP